MTHLPPSALVRAVRSELGTPGRYHLRQAPPQRSFLSELWDWIWLHVSNFFHALFAHVHVTGSEMNALGIFVIVVCVVGIIAICVNLARRIQLEAAGRAPSAPIASVRSAQAFAQEAASAAAAGDYERAVRALFVASVIALDLHGMIADDRGATINDLRRALSMRREALVSPFSAIARAYTDAAYAERAPDRASFERAAQAYGMLEQGLRG